MKNRKTFLIIGIVVLVICVGLFGFLCMGNNNTINYMPAKLTKINYNNYYSKYNQFDCNGDMVAFIEEGLVSNRLITVDQNGNSESIDGVEAPFCLTADGVFYLKNSELIKAYFNGNDNEKIASSVLKFCICEEYIVLLTNEYELRVLNCENDVCYQMNDVSEFVIYEKTVYFSDDTHKQIAYMDLGDFKVSKLCDFSFNSSPYTLQATSDYLIIDHRLGDLDIIKLSDKTLKSVKTVENTAATDHRTLICDDEYLYLSYQATDVDGSVVRNKESDQNGLWQISLKDFSKNKVCDKYFEQLYIYDNNGLFGVEENNCYKIDDKAKTFNKIA